MSLARALWWLDERLELAQIPAACLRLCGKTRMARARGRALVWAVSLLRRAILALVQRFPWQ